MAMAQVPQQERSKQHIERIVNNNSNETFSQIILPAFKDIWDFKDKFNKMTARQALVKIQNCAVVNNCYDSYGESANTAIRVYTLQSFVYAKMNEALRGDQADILEMFAPYIYQLMEGLNARKGYSGIVYRGIHLKSSLIKKYVKDSHFFWPGFTSCSMDPTVAMNWNSNCIFKIGIPKRFAHSCVDIEALSAFQKEKEVLVQPYCCYRVLDNKYDAQLSKHVITLLIEATCYNLSGIWTNHDTEHGVQNAGTYFIAQYGKDVFWFGRKEKAQWDFANVGHGTISCYVLFMHCSLFVHVSYRWKRFWISNQHKNKKMSHLGGGDGAVGDGKGADTLTITWSDLPIAKDRFSGELKLQIAADYLKMDKVADSSNMFWGNVWMRQSNMFLDDFAMDLSCKWKSDGGLSGIWKGNYGGIYIISTVKYGGNTQISWIAHSEQMGWAHVAQGVIDGDRISVIWGDLLIGMDRYNGTLECVIKSMTEIIVKKSSPKGVFMTKFITRSNADNISQQNGNALDDEKEDQ